MRRFREWRFVLAAVVIGLALPTVGRADPVSSRAARPATESDDEAGLPEFDQAAIAAEQRARIAEVREQLNLKLFAGESDHFLLFSDLQSPVRRAILIWLEDLRTKAGTLLGIGPDERLWDGKCLVLVFSRQESLAEYARTFDNHHVRHPRGYFALEARRRRDPRLVHIAAYEPVGRGNAPLREVLMHETTHAMVELYRQSAPLPLWVHEGLAEYMTVAVDPGLRTDKQAPAYRRASEEPYRSIRDIFTHRFTAANIEAYSISMGLVDCLQSIDAHGVMDMVELLKEGVEPEQALGRAYPGLDYKELERRWLRFVLTYYGPPAEPDDQADGRPSDE